MDNTVVNTKRGWIGCNPRRQPLCALLTLLLLELLLAYQVPGDLLTQSPMLARLVGLVEQLAPVIGKVSVYGSENGEVIRVYLALTLLVVPVKVWLFYLWLNSDRNGIYRYLVITPLTTTKPAGGDNFVTDPLRQARAREPETKPRSAFSRVFWSTLILLITSGIWWAILGSENTTSPQAKGLSFYKDIASGEFGMWFSWVLKYLIFASFLFAVSICILRDYMILLGRWARLLRRVNHE
ncbi:MAG: hypothetical protein U5S82_00475 [Gammaproteobacteria bacterium]|nr:hypothetical protein [Gammaproteobacteria bacterium]